MEAAEVGGADVAAAARVEVDRFHCQVPALAQAGLVRYDSGSGLVEVTRRDRVADVRLRLKVEPRTAVGSD